MPIGKIASRRELGSFASQQAQIQGQEAARSVNDTKRRLDDQILLGLAQDYITTSQSLKAIPLSFPVKKGDLWFLEYWGLSKSSGAGGVFFAVMGPAGSGVTGIIESSTANVAVANWFLQAITDVNTATAACHAGATNAGRPDRLQARVDCNTDGRIAIGFASVTAASTSVVGKRALLRATRYTQVLP